MLRELSRRYKFKFGGKNVFRSYDSISNFKLHLSEALSTGRQALPVRTEIYPYVTPWVNSLRYIGQRISLIIGVDLVGVDLVEVELL